MGSRTAGHFVDEAIVIVAPQPNRLHSAACVEARDGRELEAWIVLEKQQPGRDARVLNYVGIEVRTPNIALTRFSVGPRRVHRETS